MATENYSNLAMVQTRDGMTYFGMHNNGHSDPKEGNLTLHAVRFVPTALFDKLKRLTFQDLSEKLSIMRDIGFEGMDELAIIKFGLAEQDYSRGFNYSSRINLDVSSITRMEDLPDICGDYYKHNVGDPGVDRVLETIIDSRKTEELSLR